MEFDSLILGRNVLIVCLVFIAVFLISYIGNVQSSEAQPAQSSPTLFPHDSEPYNVTMDEWLIRYWNWVGSIEEDLLPRNDENGENCGIKQSGPVWFLDFKIPENGLTYTKTKNCEIPEGKAIFIPSHVGECDQAEQEGPVPLSDEKLEGCAKSGNNGGHIELSIDGKDFYNGRHRTTDSPEEYSLYRKTTEFFNLTYVEGNLFGSTAGTYRAIADGYFSIVQPLPAGNHTIVLHSDQTSGPLNARYVVDHTWNIIIKRTSN